MFKDKTIKHETSIFKIYKQGNRENEVQGIERKLKDHELPLYLNPTCKPKGVMHYIINSAICDEDIQRSSL